MKPFLCLMLLLQNPAKDLREQGTLKVGDTAPGFNLELYTEKAESGTERKQVKLADLKGKPVLLFFGSCT